MNKSTPLSLLVAAAAAVSPLSAATSDIVGYVTETLSPASFNLIGFNLSNPVVAAGEFESSAGTTLVDAEADFTTALAGGGEFFLKVTNGTDSLGLNTEVTAASATELSSGDDISSMVGAGATYEIRRVLTVADVFGASNEAGILGANAGDRTTADIIWIPDGVGGFSQVFYNATAGSGFGALGVGWKSTSTGNSDASGTPIYFTSGVFVQVQRSSFDPAEEGYVDANTKNLIVSGSVQPDDSQVVLESGFNFVSRVFPSGVTLGDSGLENDLDGASAGDRTNADIIWVPDGVGGYDQYFYNATPGSGFGALTVGWKGTATGNTDASDVELSSGVIIERKGAATMVTMKIPASVAGNL